MLVLTMHDHGEPVIISLPDGRTIEVAIVSGNGRVRVGFTAPADIGVDRRSIWQEKRENQNL